MPTGFVSEPSRTPFRALVAGPALPLVATALFFAGCSEPPDIRSNILLVTVDALRADHLGVWGYRLETSRNIDRLAASGVRFADATVQWPKTWPSMVSMLTGTYPATSGIRMTPRRPLPAESVTLAEILRGAGYRTGAVVANVNLGKAFAFDQGFEHFVESWVEEVLRRKGKTTFRNAAGRVKQFTNAERVTDQAIALLDELSKEGPFFLWLHYIDPHGPYVAPPGYAHLFVGEHPPQPVPIADLPRYQVQRDERGAVVDDLGFYRAQYDREIRYVDDQLGRLLAALDERHLRKRTLIVLTADHGESLGENRYYLEHGALPYQSTVHVPLIVAQRGRLPAGRLIDEPVGLIDLAPTILELLDVERPSTIQGTSLAPSILGTSEAGARLVFLESGSEDRKQFAVRRGRWKLVQLLSEKDRAWVGRNELELFDLSRDPGEEKDLLEAQRGVAAELESALAQWRSATSRYQGSKPIDLHQLDPRSRQQLEALGYLEDRAREPPTEQR